MGCLQSKGIVHAYYEPNGELVQFNHPKFHKAKEELVFVSSQDTKQFSAEDECYVITAKWLEGWLEFAMRKKKALPGPISNHTLLNSNGDSIEQYLKPRVDYRPINKAVWEYLFQLYGGGPVITFKVPAGLSPDQYKSGKWIKKIVLHDIITIIIPNSFPKPNSYQMIGNPMANNTPNSSNKEKVNRDALLAKEAQINQANMEAIGALMNKDLGKKKMNEAKEKDEEATRAAAEAIANQMAGGLSAKLKREADAAHEQSQKAHMESVGAVFTSGNDKKRFKEALARGNMTDARICAANMLKSAWRTKLARRRMLALKAQRQKLLEESMARKLQSKYRARLANKRMMALRAERDRLRQEGAAIMLQSSWRCRKSRQKIEKLKQEKYQLLCEKCALRLQMAWRIKQSKMIFMGKLTARNQLVARKNQALEKIAPLLRVMIARMKYREKMRAQPHVFIVSLKSAMGINIGDVTTSDPYVYIHGESKGLSPNSSQSTHALSRPVSMQSVTSGNTKSNASSGSTPKSPSSPLKRPSSTYNSSNTLSVYKSKVHSPTVNPNWNEECIVTNTTGYDDLVLTLMDKDTLTADDFLGQTVIPLRNYPTLFNRKHNAVNLNLLPINSFSTPVHDAHGKEIPLGSRNTPGKGNWFVSIKLAPLIHTHAGWLQRQSGSLLGFGSTQFKYRYVVLHDHRISYYDDAHSLSAHPRGVMLCSDMKAIHYGPDKSGELTLELESKDETWQFHWGEGDSEASIHTWLRKIQFACSKVPINGVPGGYNANARSSIASAVSNQVITSKSQSTIKRRASNMFTGFTK